MVSRAEKKGPTWTPLPAILVAVVLAILLSLILFEPISIDGASMEPGIGRGRTVILLRTAYGLRLPFSERYLVQWKSPERDDIIVFRAPNQKQKLMKRVAVAVDEYIQIYGDIMILNNNSVLLDPKVASELSRYDRMPPGFVFVTGDNLAVSRDSRHFGFVPSSSILGRVIVPPEMRWNERNEP